MKLTDLYKETDEAVTALWTPKKMTDDEIIAWCKENSSTATSNQQRIYRGTKTGFSGLLNTKNLNRRSSSNYSQYNLWIDNVWEGYPKRSQSIICTTQSSTARSFGQTYIIIPSDNCQIGICPAYDMWDSFKMMSTHFSLEANDFFSKLAKTLDRIALPQSWAPLKKLLKATTVENLQSKKSPFANQLISLMERENVNDLYSFFEESFLNDKHNDFRVITADELYPLKNRELWISGEIMQLEMSQISDKVMSFLDGTLINVANN